MAHAPALGLFTHVGDAKYAGCPPAVDDLTLCRVHKDESHICAGQMTLLAQNASEINTILP